MVLDRSRLWIPTPRFNQSSWGKSGKYCNPVLSVRLVGSRYGLSIMGLQLVTAVSCLVMEKMIPTPSQVRISIQRSLLGKCNQQSIFMYFLWFSSLIPRLLHPTLESVTGSVPVENPH